jgi:heptosyltransferase-2
MSAPRKILIRGVNWLGDAVMSMPAVQRLKEKFPESEITILTPAKLEDLWRMHPCVEDVIAITPEESVFQVSRRLRWGRFDATIVFPNSPRSAIEPWLAKIPRRIGYKRPWRNFFLTEKVPARADEVKMHKRSVSEINKLIADPSNSGLNTPNSELSPSHHVHQYLHLVAMAFGASAEPIPPRLSVSDDGIRKFKQSFTISESDRPLFGLNPGAEYGPAKRWPKERFILAASELAKKTNCRWLIFGSKADKDLAAEIVSGIQANFPVQTDFIFNVAGRTSLRELCVGLKSCRVLLTNDTGPMHLAAAVGTPVVALFGSTSPALTGPIPDEKIQHQFVKSDAACSPCFLRQCPIDFRCMAGISIDAVVNSVLQITPP